MAEDDEELIFEEDLVEEEEGLRSRFAIDWKKEDPSEVVQ